MNSGGGELDGPPAARLGEDAYGRRIAEERRREDEFHRLLSTKGTYLKIHALHPLIGAVLRLMGLWRRGRRELLDTVVRENEVEIDGLPASFDGYRILHLSDLHIDPEPALADSIIRAVAPLDYDLCVMTGDYRWLTVGPQDAAIALMARLRPAFRTDVLCVLGNHDPISLAGGLEAAGYKVLLNEAEIVRRGGDALCVAGVDDPAIFGTHDIGRALAAAPRGCVRILLSHTPGIYGEAEAAGVSLLLAGHTHGGQICLPGGRALKVNCEIPRPLVKGAWRFGALQGYTTAGCGASGVQVRLNCPSEVVVHTLRRRRPTL